MAILIENLQETDEKGNRYAMYRCTHKNCSVIFKHKTNGGTHASCGCANVERLAKMVERSVKHRMSFSPEYKTRRRIISRCYYEKDDSFADYGGKGVKVCQLWLYSFDDFYKDMGPQPSKKHSIDRIDPNGNYCPNNCRWATMKEQQNSRNGNKYFYYNYKYQTLSRWADEMNTTNSALGRRIKKWGIELALTKEKRKHVRNKSKQSVE